MKKFIIIFFIAGFLAACGGQTTRQAEELDAPIELETDLEEALQMNIELNERIGELEAELDSLLNNI
jgi:hypothetical protein